MDASTLQSIGQNASVWLTQFGLKALGALAIWIVARRLIAFSVRLVGAGLRRQPIDPTVIGFTTSAISVLLHIVLVVALLGFFGVETTSFAALLAGAGLAIGAAWSGLLSNFAAGVFLMILRPFKAGDFISAGGVTGTVEEVGLFASVINTPDNIRTIVGNSKIFADNIQNFSANPYRRVDVSAAVPGGVDVSALIRRVDEQVRKIPNVRGEPAPLVEVQQFTAFGPVLAVRPYTSNEAYWQVYFDTHRLLRESFGAVAFPPPNPRAAAS
jgi:small conductance mechanosensitive channel